MLMDHTDPLADRILWRFDRCRLSLKNNLALIRCFQSEQYLHQRTLTGTVLSKHRVNLPLTKLKGYIFIGYHTITVNFHNVVHL